MALSTTGIAHQILSALITYQNNYGTINDCKVVLNHLIRKFSEPLKKENRQKSYNSKMLKSSSKVVEEHLVPVNIIMNYFLELNSEIKLNHNKETVERIEDYLEETLTIVFITKKEDMQLNKVGLQKQMPSEYYEVDNILFNDKWARYIKADIFKNIIFN